MIGLTKFLLGSLWVMPPGSSSGGLFGTSAEGLSSQYFNAVQSLLI